MRFLLAAVIIFSAITNGYALELSAYLSYAVTSEKQSVPTDVIIESEDTVGIYDAFKGSFTTYKDGKAVSTVTKDILKGGNCLVKSGEYNLYCNSKSNSLDLLTNSFGLYASVKIPKLDPTDVVARSGFAYVADNDNHRIVKIDLAALKESESVGKYGTDRLHFWYPYSVAMDKDGKILVSEVLNTRIQKITPELKFYEYIGSWGINEGQFYRPTGMAFYKDFLLVADGYTGIIQYFNKDGKFAGVLKDNKGTTLKLGSITHIRVSGNTLAVVDAYEKTVYVYKLRENN